MKVRIETQNPRKSAYLHAGAPTHCFLPSCRKRFDNTCCHGRDGHYYCSQDCTDVARELGLAQVQELRRRSA
jgi:hypothetical protein